MDRRHFCGPDRWAFRTIQTEGPNACPRSTAEMIVDYLAAGAIVTRLRLCTGHPKRAPAPSTIARNSYLPAAGGGASSTNRSAAPAPTSTGVSKLAVKSHLANHGKIPFGAVVA